MRWIIGFFLHEMAFGLLSIFLPLYVTGGSISGGNLFIVGVMVALATFLGIPFSYLWGYLGERIGRFKPFILMSFGVMAVLLYFFASSTDVLMLILLYGAIAIFHVAHEAPKNVFIAESYSHEDWEKNFATYELLTEIGWLIGIVLGFLTSVLAFDARSILLITSGLNLVAFITSVFLVSDPPLIFERGLVGMEKTLNFAQRGFALMWRADDGEIVKDKLKNENALAYFAGLVLFSLATSIFFTPLPVFFSKPPIGLPESLVFAIFTINSAGGCFGYLFARHNAHTQSGGEKTTLKRTVLARGVLALFLASPIILLSVSTQILAVIVLTLMGFVYSLFLTSTLSISMEVLPEGKTGLFNVLIGVGAAAGCLIGPSMAEMLGFLPVFIVSSVIFLLSYVAFKIFA